MLHNGLWRPSVVHRHFWEVCSVSFKVLVGFSIKKAISKSFQEFSHNLSSPCSLAPNPFPYLFQSGFYYTIICSCRKGSTAQNSITTYRWEQLELKATTGGLSVNKHKVLKEEINSTDWMCGRWCCTSRISCRSQLILLLPFNPLQLIAVLPRNEVKRQKAGKWHMEKIHIQNPLPLLSE